jgi:hypothetical protein
MNLERSRNGTQFGDRDDFDMTDADGVERAVEIFGPEIEKLVQFGEFGRVVEFLPDETLQDAGVIGHVIQDFGGCHPPALQLLNKFSSHQKYLLLRQTNHLARKTIASPVRAGK